MRKIFISITMLGLFLTMSPIFAADPVDTDGKAVDTAKSSGAAVTLQPPIAVQSPQQFIGKLINAALGIVGSLALLMFIYGGFTWLTSAGSSDKVTKGKNTLVWATIGLTVIFMSYAAVKFVIDRIAN